ncbi:unnamed protein product, partial [Amoebophrya sp. A25]|eukprot:GSA25T00017592001.1
MCSTGPGDASTSSSSQTNARELSLIANAYAKTNRRMQALPVLHAISEYAMPLYLFGTLQPHGKKFASWNKDGKGRITTFSGDLQHGSGAHLPNIQSSSSPYLQPGHGGQHRALDLGASSSSGMNGWKIVGQPVKPESSLQLCRQVDPAVDLRPWRNG